MCAKFGCGLMVVSKKKGGVQTDRQTDRQTDKGTLQFYIVDKIYVSLIPSCMWNVYGSTSPAFNQINRPLCILRIK